MRRLVAVRAGLPLYLVKGHPQIVDIGNRGCVTVAARRHPVAVGAGGPDVSALELVVVIMLESDRRPERLLAVARLAGTSQDPRMDVFVAIDAVLGQPQIGRTTRLRGKLGQRERHRVPVARVTGEAIMGPRQREGDVRMVEEVGIAALPRQCADRWKGASEMVWMTTCARDRFPLEQEGMISAIGLDLAGDLHVAPEAALREPRAGVTGLAGRHAGPADRLGMRYRQRSR